MTARQMAALLDRPAFIHTTDGLVPCVVRDVKTQYGTLRLVVEVTGALNTNGTFTKVTVPTTVDAARVYFQSAANDDLLVPTAEVWS
jgi:hypothetical protein